MSSTGNTIPYEFDLDAINSNEGFKNEMKPTEEEQQPIQSQEQAEEENTGSGQQDNQTGAQEDQQQAESSESSESGDQNQEQSEENTTTDISASSPTPTELDDSQVLAFLNQRNGANYTSFDDVFKTIEVEKIVEKEPELPNAVKALWDYMKETGRGMQDFLETQRDYSQMTNLDLARDAIRKENIGLQLTDSETNILLADKFGVEVEDLSTLQGKDLLRLKTFSNRHLQSLLGEQQKYKLPKEDHKPKQSQEAQPVGEQVKLSNGQLVNKEVYEAQRKKYIQDQSRAIQSLDSADYSISLDQNGEKTNISFKYDYTNEDRHSMQSLTSDVNGILPRYQSEDGFDHKSFNEDLWWSVPQNREKAIKRMLVHAKSIGVDEVMKERKNINFKQEKKPTREKTVEDGYANDKIGVLPTGSFGVKYGLPTD